MTTYKIDNDYFEWLCDWVCHNDIPSDISFRKLLMYLHHTEFTWELDRDENRADDGIQLRRRFLMFMGYSNNREVDSIIYRNPCSVLEMMIALAIRCEETIMDDPNIGDRTGQWFWRMVTSLGLNGMYDSKFDKQKVHDTIFRFLHRDYEPDGRGGLFTVRGRKEDLRDVEIWYQLNWYLDKFIG